MKIIIKKTIDKDKIILEPLFVYEDGSLHQTSLDTILENMNNLLSDEQKSIITFVSLYAGNYDFEDCPPRYGRNAVNDISFLLRVVEGHADRILRVSSHDYELEASAKLLNNENTDQNRSYQVFSVRGRLSEKF